MSGKSLYECLGESIILQMSLNILRPTDKRSDCRINLSTSSLKIGLQIELVGVSFFVLTTLWVSENPGSPSRMTRG